MTFSNFNALNLEVRKIDGEKHSLLIIVIDKDSQTLCIRQQELFSYSSSLVIEQLSTVFEFDYY